MTKRRKGKDLLKLLMYSLSQVVQYHWQKPDKDSRRNHASQNRQKRFRSTCLKCLVPFPNTCGVLHTYSTFKYLYSFEKRKWIKRRDRQRRRSMRRWRPYSERRYRPRNCLHLIFIAFLQDIVLLSCIYKTSYGHLACVWIQCFFMIPL